MWCNFFLDAKRIPPNWDQLMKLSCVPSVLITQEIWTRYVARCPVEVAPEDESYRDQDADNDNGGADEGVENSGTDEGDWQRQAKCLVLQMLEACGRDESMKRQVLDHLEAVVQDVQLMVQETSGATRASGARMRPFYDR